MERLRTPHSLVVAPEEKGEVQMLVDIVVVLVQGGVTGMDLLEVFLSRQIQRLQARDQPMWMYSGPEDTARTHPEEVNEETVAQWLRSITSNKDNPRGSRKILPFDANNAPGEVRLPTVFPLFCGCSWIRLISTTCVLQVCTKLHSMSNEEQYQEGLDSDSEGSDN